MLAMIKSHYKPKYVSYIISIIILISFLEDIFMQESTSTLNEPVDREIDLKTLQQITEGCLKFTDSYCLKADIIDDQLLVMLADFKNWTVYKRNYTKADIGAQINRKLDLQDILSSLQRQTSLSNGLAYKFGTNVSSQAGQPLFSIQQQGQLTVYVKIWTNNKAELIKSTLNLLKMKELSQIQIFSVKMQLQKRELMTYMQKQIKILKSQNNRLKGMIEQIQQCNGKCGKSIDNANKQTDQVHNQNVNQEIEHEGCFGSDFVRSSTQSRVFVSY